ncbi:LAME_0B06920g1_1 [Lachancea meyersii CBS 8951]|uniref:LAME_0B06920g1_1 n=1 Tax=Lachancea meyersii CBS 8951 TaxID=1266667 RepID=A0A1G4IWF2_9SACH|nr:LAME_0B06920g1_1 [Lachancea meyersii CBS 8951]
MKILLAVAFLVNCIHVLCSQQDPWDTVAKHLASLPKHKDCLINSAQEWDPFQGGINITLPIDYYEEEQELNWAAFLASESNENRLMFTELVRSSEDFDNVEATYSLAQMLLLQQYGVPQNKTLAYHYMCKFNELTDYMNGTAVFELGLMHITGLFGTIPVDVAHGLILYERAAELGDLRARMALAYRHSLGRNVPLDQEKSLFLYRSLAHELRKKYTDVEWNLFHPLVESYLVSIPDFTGGLLGSGLSSSPSTVRRLRASRPDVTSSILTNLHPEGVVLHFGSGFHDFIEDDEENRDKLVDIYYTALDNFRGTYTQRRNSNASAEMLNVTIAEYSSYLQNMDTLQRYYYGKCLELWGHILFTGDGVSRPDIDAAERILTNATNVLKSNSYSAHLDLGLINQYFHRNAAVARQHYRFISSGEVFFQVYQLDKSNLSRQQFVDSIYLDSASEMGHPQACYEFAMKKEGLGGASVYDLHRAFKEFVESQESFVAPHMKDAFLALLRGDTEAALWLYVQAAEQGIQTAQTNVAFILYQPSYVVDEPPFTSDERKLLAAQYYSLDSMGYNRDSAVVAGNVFFEMGDYEQAAGLYQFCSGSALGKWHLGYMHEYGLGVEQDFELAKRHYESALELNPALFLGVKLSLFKLELKSWFLWLTSSAERFSWFAHGQAYQKSSKEAFHTRMLKKVHKARHERQERTGSSSKYYGLPTLKDAVLIIGIFAIFLMIQLVQLVRTLLARPRGDNFGGINFHL